MNKEDQEKQILKVLEAEPLGFEFNDLSEKIIQKIQLREKAERRSMIIFYITTIAIFLLLSGIGLIYFLGMEKIREMQSVLYTGLVFGCLLMVIQWLDYKLIMKKSVHF
ncbi:MAG: hypothetical protein ACFHWX_03665 [Bacteroidota bacterium]